MTLLIVLFFVDISTSFVHNCVSCIIVIPSCIFQRFNLLKISFNESCCTLNNITSFYMYFPIVFNSACSDFNILFLFNPWNLANSFPPAESATTLSIIAVIVVIIIIYIIFNDTSCCMIWIVLFNDKKYQKLTRKSFLAKFPSIKRKNIYLNSYFR